MKVKQLNDKILIAELDPKADYICIANPALVRGRDLKLIKPLRRKSITIVWAHDIKNAIRFVKIPKK